MAEAAHPELPALLPLAGLPGCRPGCLPPWAGRFLAAEADPLGGQAWYATTLAAALPAGSEACAAVTEAVLLPLLRRGRRLGSLTTEYSLAFRPLPAPGADAPALHRAGRDLARLLRRRPPIRLEALDPEAPGLAALLEGCRAGGLLPLRYRHFGNWAEEFPPGTGWEAYLATRPPALRNTIGRKLARARRAWRFELVAAPGPALEAGIGAFEAVRAASWKPAEPAPRFDAALMRALAPSGGLRLGLLWQGESAVAAQYWVLHQGRATIPKLFHLEAARAGSPGTVLTALMIRHLLEVDAVRALDFGRGDDDYKQLWVGRRRQRIGVELADPWHPEGLLAIARQRLGALRRRAGTLPA